LVVLDELLNNGLLDHAAQMGEYLKTSLSGIVSDKIATVRGKGLMLGIVFTDDIAKEVGNRLREAGFLVGVIGTKVLRIVPPLVLEKQDIDAFAEALVGVLNAL
ncbi:MAG: aminotransferase class III-fold pyridoxal phosphate-dependent enzyme, partial [Clostridia bacterium]|nr:aminotransferase class III-fold pyridoxal phosphate-dependent enzyme [Clostridia bacterium]